MWPKCASGVLNMNNTSRTLHKTALSALILSLVFTVMLIYEYKNSIVIGDSEDKRAMLNHIETADTKELRGIAHTYVSDLYGYQDQTIRFWVVCLAYGVLNISLMAFCIRKLKYNAGGPY